MEVDTTPTSHRTRSSKKRARSPSSPTQYDRPSKRVASGACHDMSIPLPFAPFYASTTRLCSRSDDWVFQTQDLRIQSPALSHTSGMSTPIALEEGETHADDVMIDEPMHNDDNAMLASPQTAPLGLPPPLQTHPVQYLRLPDHRPSGTPPPYHNPNQLQIPSIQVQAATPSPVQMFSQPPFDAPPYTPSSSSTTTDFSNDPFDDPGRGPPIMFTPSCEDPRGPPPAPARKQRFTMGPRADCDLCRTRVKGHYMHFD